MPFHTLAFILSRALCLCVSHPPSSFSSLRVFCRYREVLPCKPTKYACSFCWPTPPHRGLFRSGFEGSLESNGPRLDFPVPPSLHTSWPIQIGCPSLRALLAFHLLSPNTTPHRIAVLYFFSFFFHENLSLSSSSVPSPLAPPI